MKYDGRKLLAPNLQEIIAVWDNTSSPGYTGECRWLCKATDGLLYLYWCLDDADQKQGSWIAVKDRCWLGIAENYPPVWSYSDADLATAQVKKCVCDLHQLMRGDGHNTNCPEKPVT